MAKFAQACRSVRAYTPWVSQRGARPDGEEADQCVGRYHGGGVVKQYGVPRDEGGGDKGGNQEHVEAAAASGGAAAVHQALPLDAHGKQAAEQDGFPGGQACPVAFHVLLRPAGRRWCCRWVWRMAWVLHSMAMLSRCSMMRTPGRFRPMLWW